MDGILDFNLTGEEVNLDPTFTDTSGIDFAENVDALEPNGGNVSPNNLDLSDRDPTETSIDANSIETSEDFQPLEAVDNVDPLTGDRLSLESYPDLAFGFFEDVRQNDPIADFLAVGRNDLQFNSEGAIVDNVTIEFAEDNPNAILEPVAQLPGVVNFLIGDNSDEWITGIPTYEGIAYRNVYDNIDVVYRDDSRQLEQNFEIAAGADPAQIQINDGDISNIEIHEDGTLQLDTLNLEQPTAYQTIDGQQVEIPVSYQFRNFGRVGFNLGNYNPNAPLTISVQSEPIFNKQVHNIDEVAIDSHGAGYTSDEFGEDIFISKIASDGSHLLYTTYFGGEGVDTSEGIAADESGNAYIAGGTISPDLPTLNAYNSELSVSPDDPNHRDVFVSKLSENGTLAYSTYLGGGGIVGDFARDIAVNDRGQAYVVGATSAGIPIINDNIDASGPAGGRFPAGVGFITKLASNGQNLLYSLQLGGGIGGAVAEAVDVDGEGNAYVTGWDTGELRTVNPVQEEFFGVPSVDRADLKRDAFVLKLSPDGQQLLFSTHYGDFGINSGRDIIVDNANKIHFYVDRDIVTLSNDGQRVESVYPLALAGTNIGRNFITNQDGELHAVRIDDTLTGATPIEPDVRFQNLIEYTRSNDITPTEIFYDEQFYLNQNPDVNTAVEQGVFANGFDHYMRYGQFEGRDPSQMFDEDNYLAFYPDVANAVEAGFFKSGFDHFTNYGFYEGRSRRSAQFDENYYLQASPGVADAVDRGFYSSGYEHYVEDGRFQQRSPNQVFDEGYYRAKNPDVNTAIQNGVFATGFEHFLNYGEAENRSPSRLFDETIYLDRYPDVAAAVNSNIFRSGFEHFLKFGLREDRIGN